MKSVHKILAVTACLSMLTCSIHARTEIERGERQSRSQRRVRYYDDQRGERMAAGFFGGGATGALIGGLAGGGRGAGIGFGVGAATGLLAGAAASDRRDYYDDYNDEDQEPAHDEKYTQDDADSTDFDSTESDSSEPENRNS